MESNFHHSTAFKMQGYSFTISYAKAVTKQKGNKNFSKTCEMTKSTSINSKIWKVILKDRECM